MSTVWMRHPDLPPEQLIEVPEESVPHHGRAGWVPVGKAEAEAAAARIREAFSQPEPPAAERDASPPDRPEPPEAPEKSGASSLEPKTPRRRRAHEESE